MSEIMNIKGIECYEENGMVYLNLETVARGLGFTDNSKGVEYVRWNTVTKYLQELKVSQEVAKDSFIPENIFYRLAMKAKNETAEKFQALIADEIIPSIRKTGTYGNPKVPTSTFGQIQLLAQGYIELEQKITETNEKVTTVEKRMDILEDTTVVNYQQRRKLKSVGSKVVISALGGKYSNAYKNSAVRARAFIFMWNEFKDHFELTTYQDTPKARFNEALKYLEMWTPNTNLRLEIETCNEEVAV